MVYFYSMQVQAKSNKLSLKIILCFVAILFIAFLPIASCLFFIKNDAFTGYFPPKFFMSEAIHAGYLPLWNPYINFGFPQYGDMSSGYWSPITWLVAATVGYNAYTFTFEVLFYILLSGIGMYQLTSAWNFDKRVAVIAAVALMCCGYNVGHLQHFNWLSGAAFLPWCCWSYWILLKHPSTKNYLQAVLLLYLLVSSAHPGITISTGYFFMGILLFNFLSTKKRLSLYARLSNLVKTHTIFLLLFLLLAAGMITGYLDIMPYFVRGEKISLASALSNPTNLQSWLSLLFPFATVKNNDFFNTDITMRNCYCGVGVLLFFMLSCCSKKNSWQIFLLITGLLFAALSTGGMVKIFAYKFIPFIGYVRLNGEFRIFSLLCFISIATIELNKFVQQRKQFTGTIIWLYKFLQTLIIASIFIAGYNAITSHQSIIYQLGAVGQQAGIAAKLKTIIDGISFYDCFWIQGIVQLLILRGIKWSLINQNFNLLRNIVIADMVIASLLNVPFTGVGKASVSQVQAVINQSPHGIPIPTLQFICATDSLTSNETEMVGNWSMYNKQPGTRQQVPYPILLKNMDAYFKHQANYPTDNYLQQPFIFIADTQHRNKITITNFSPNKVSLTAEASNETQLILQQNFYPHWFYQDDKTNTAVGKAGINFMVAPVKKGINHIIFSFEPTAVKWAMLWSAVLFTAYTVLLVILLFKRPSPS